MSASGNTTGEGGGPRWISQLGVRTGATGVVGGVMIAGLLAPIGCQSAGGRGPAPRALHLADMQGYLEFVARDRNNTQNSKTGAANRRLDETIIEESIQLETDGYVYHPNFLEFTLGGLFGLFQQRNRDVIDDRDRLFTENGDICEFNFDGHFFKKKPYPGSVYTRRYRSIDPRPFQASLETTTTAYGLNWQYVSAKFPTSLQFSYTNVDLDSLDPQEADGLQRDAFLRFETGYRISENNELSLKYEHRETKQEPFTLDYDSDDVTLSHDYRFGDRMQYSLESELNYFDQRGTFRILRKRWRETFRVDHTETLRSWFRLELLDRTQSVQPGVPPLEETSYYLSGTLEHELYESLFSEFFAFGQRQEFGSGLEIDRWGAQASFNYRKRNPWGRLVMNYLARFQQEDREGGEQPVQIVDEVRTFNDPDPVVLANETILRNSVRITVEQRTTLYQEGSDYRVVTFPDRIEIERVPTGRIQDGETVLIDYAFVLGSDFDLDTYVQNFGVRQEFDFGLSPYYRLRWQDQDITPEDARGAIAEDITSHLVGAEFERAGLRFLAEYEDFDSNITPFIAVRLGTDYTRRFEFGATGTLKARWTQMEYRQPDRTRRFFTIEGRWRHAVTQHLTVESALMFRRERDTFGGADEGVDFDLSLEWMIRQTEVRLTYEYSEFDDDFSDNEYSRLYVQVRRSF